MGRGEAPRPWRKVELLRLGDSEKLKRWPREPLRKSTNGNSKKTSAVFSES